MDEFPFNLQAFGVFGVFVVGLVTFFDVIVGDRSGERLEVRDVSHFQVMFYGLFGILHIKQDRKVRGLAIEHVCKDGS